ncbi:cysteine-rich protein 1-like [Ornithorhynchus anatinus]|uniref:cysteine-rich protein 1-like n=1 Tax=Ornithorhynchus anatinus TaxID=9258 RepID=UPI0010A79D0F|nr:cysteine-rich protein 1-like [Ornithorhynchus anatinus]
MISYFPFCGKPVYFAEKKRSLGRDYHPLCLKCSQCKWQFSPGQHAEYDDRPYCNHCYLRRFGPRGTRHSLTSLVPGAASSKVPVPSHSGLKTES